MQHPNFVHGHDGFNQADFQHFLQDVDVADTPQDAQALVSRAVVVTGGPALFTIHFWETLTGAPVRRITDNPQAVRDAWRGLR